jgi:hypothetical protein
VLIEDMKRHFLEMEGKLPQGCEAVIMQVKGEWRPFLTEDF